MICRTSHVTHPANLLTLPSRPPTKQTKQATNLWARNGGVGVQADAEGRRALALQSGRQRPVEAALQLRRRSIDARLQLPHKLQFLAPSCVELQAADLRGHSVQQAAVSL